MSIPAHINWPDDLTDQLFLNQYWQRRPLLCRQAYPGFESPVTPDDLAFFACEPGATSRLILKNDAGHAVEHGPFSEKRFATLTKNDWSLLVTDVEKHWPELQHYLYPFQFLPSWRIDDLMISYAPDGASVGAHVDAYDVFLLQATGTREWHIDENPNAEYPTNQSGDLAHIEGFAPTHTYVLAPGDMLYLPPGVAHHGIAQGDECTTWSIGFRAPSQSDIVDELCNVILQKLDDTRFTDPGRNISSHGEIDAQSLEQLKVLWDEAVTLTKEEFNSFAGSLLTYPHPLIEDAESEETAVTAVDTHQVFELNPFSRLAYIKAIDGVSAKLYVDGESHDCSLEFAKNLCEPNASLSLAKINTPGNDLAELNLQLFNRLVSTSVLLEEPAE